MIRASEHFDALYKDWPLALAEAHGLHALCIGIGTVDRYGYSDQQIKMALFEMHVECVPGHEVH